MSEEMNANSMESIVDTIENKLQYYSTRLIERTIERALDVIYEQTNDLDPKIHEWRHSQDQIVAPTDN